jgi:hypothetical protein
VSRPLFTPASARRAIDALRPAAERVCRLYREIERRAPVPIAPEQRVEPGYFALVRRLHDELAEIRRQGARIGDLRSGLVDFPARRGGKRVWLSWRVGEPTLEFWREVGAGHEGRQPLDEDGPWEEA